MQNGCCVCVRACVRGLPSLANGAGLFLTVCVRRSAKLRMSQDSTIHTHARSYNPVPQGFVGSNPTPRIVSILISFTGLKKRKKHKTQSFRIQSRYSILIRSKKFTKKKKPSPANEISEDDINKFITSIKNKNTYSKVKDLPKIIPSLNSVKITTILRYLERSKRLILDSDGYIIWIRQDHQDNNADRLSFEEVANFKGNLRDRFIKEDNKNDEN